MKPAPARRSLTCGRAWQSLGALPSTDTVVAERFFDESGGMQLILHAPFGSRINRAWGLALRKRFCRTFNFELQAAATDNGIVISLSEQHAFPLETVFEFLHSDTVEDVLREALLAAPMFGVRWRWNASRALTILRFRGGAKVPAPIQRMRAEDLLASVFPDQVACAENLTGPIRIPDHPLVNETISNCLHEAMDVDGLQARSAGPRARDDPQSGGRKRRSLRCFRTRSSTPIPMRFWMTLRSRSAARAPCSCAAHRAPMWRTAFWIRRRSSRSRAKSGRTRAMPMNCTTRC